MVQKYSVQHPPIMTQTEITEPPLFQTVSYRGQTEPIKVHNIQHYTLGGNKIRFPLTNDTITLPRSTQETSYTPIYDNNHTRM